MSKLYQMNRMRYAPAAGDLFGIIKGAAGFVGKLLQSKATRAAVEAAKKLAQNPVAVAAGAGAVTAIGVDLLSGAPKRSGGASGSWSGRRRKGITATELRGFRKVAKLLHNEGMTIKKHRRS